MPLETVSSIKDLNPTNPVDADPIGEGNEHIKNIKKALLLDSLRFATITEALTSLLLAEGARVIIDEIVTGQSADAWLVVLTSTVTPNGTTIQQSAAIPTLSIKLQTGSIQAVNIRQRVLDNPLVSLFKPNKLVSTLAGTLTATRGSVAAYIDRYSVLRYQGGNQGTNEALWSEDFTNGAWAKVGPPTVTGNQATSPLGTLTADLVTAPAINWTLRQTSPVLVSGVVYTFSCWVKKAGTDNCNAQISLGTNSTSFVATTEWKRYSVQYTGTGVTANFGLFDTGNQAFDGFIWGAQLEASRAVNGYVKTEAVAITTPTFSTVGIQPLRETKDGVLIEGTSTNNLLHSEDLTVLPWVQVGSIGITPNDDTAPDGTVTADYVAATAGNWEVRQPFTVTLGATYTFSIWVKSKGLGNDTFRLQAADTVFYDFVATSEWVRYEVTGGGTGISQVFGIFDFNDQACDVLVWGAQLEQKGTATSYIPTTTVSLTRAADLIKVTAQPNLPDFTKEWSFSCQFSSALLPSNNAANSVLVTFGDNPITARILLKNDGQILLQDDSAARVIAPASSIVTGQMYYLVITWDGSNLRGYIDGVAQTPTSTLDLAVKTGSAVWGARESSTEELNGNLFDCRFYDRVLNVDEITLLSGV